MTTNKIYTLEELYLMGKISELEKQIEEAENVIKFYGDVDNWTGFSLKIDDTKMTETNYLRNVGGKRARGYLNKYSKQGEK